MIPQIKRNQIRQRVHSRIRTKLAGTTERPRLNVYRSLNHIYVQVIDDSQGVTLVSASTVQAKLKTGGNVAAAKVPRKRRKLCNGLSQVCPAIADIILDCHSKLNSLLVVWERYSGDSSNGIRRTSIIKRPPG